MMYMEEITSEANLIADTLKDWACKPIKSVAEARERARLIREEAKSLESISRRLLVATLDSWRPLRKDGPAFGRRTQ